MAALSEFMEASTIRVVTGGFFLSAFFALSNGLATDVYFSATEAQLIESCYLVSEEVGECFTRFYSLPKRQVALGIINSAIMFLCAALVGFVTTYKRPKSLFKVSLFVVLTSFSLDLVLADFHVMASVRLVVVVMFGFLGCFIAASIGNHLTKACKPTFGG